ncbi:MAG: PEP-CTERM sorting domain-containing protein [Verrucomicrobia bacterium]|nr:MAG: PEP-CTERM sorting domain-containing protein [Verrucomicrobiota bacterium]
MNYLGVRLLEEDGWHYGWIEIDAPFQRVNGGYMNGMAYETSANRAIVTGAIPEPATAGVVLGVVALGGVLCRRRQSLRHRR